MESADGDQQQTGGNEHQSWSTPQGDQARSGYLGGGRPTETPEQQWAIETIRGSPPAIAYGAVIVATDAGTVRAHSIESGDRCWECDVGGKLNAGVVAADERVYGGTRDGTVFAIDAETGDREWTFEPDVDRSVEINAAPTVADGTVYVPVRGNGALYAVDANTGEQSWEFEGNYYSLECTPTVANGRVYVGDGKGSFYALNATDGTELWTQDLRATFETPPATTNGLVVANADSNLLAFDAESGEQVWKQTTRHYGSPTIADGVVYAATRDGVVGYDAESGDTVVEFDPGRRLRSIAYADDHCYVGDAGGAILAVDPAAETVVWEVENEGVETDPVIADGAVFVVERSRDATVQALSDGAIDADASLGSIDLRTVTADVEDDDSDEESSEFALLAAETIDDPADPTDDELEAVVLGIICDEWVESDRMVRLNSNGIAAEVVDLVPGASAGLVKHTLRQLARKGCLGYRDQNTYALITSRPYGIHLYEEHTGEKVIEDHKLLDVLEPLYQQARHHPDAPAITREQLQTETFLDDDELDRTIWYLSTLGKWVEDFFPGAQIGYVNTRAVNTGTFWYEAEINSLGTELYNELA